MIRLAAVVAMVLGLGSASAEPTMPGSPPPALGYRLIPHFFQYPKDWALGEASGVAVNTHGHIFLFRRAKPMLSEFDAHGRFIRALGEGLFDHPHGLRIDRDDNIWTTDDTNHTVLKLNPKGEVLMVLGRRNSGGEADWLFNKPADVAFGLNGEIYVADGYGNSRIVKFDKDGVFLKAWGSYGDGPGQFKLPHTVLVGADGRVYVGDRENARIQVFDADGRFLEQWTSVGYPYGLVQGPNSSLFMVDGGFDRVIRLDSAGRVTGALGRPGHRPGEFAWAHFMAMSHDGKVIVADVLNWRFQVFVPAPTSGRLADYQPTKRHFYGFRKSDGYVYRDETGFPTR